MFITKRVITDMASTAPYLVRWSLWLPFGMSLKLHQILRPDDDRCEHDHPWWFLRIILCGGYFEHCNGSGPIHRKPWRPWAPWRIYFCGAKFRHRITALPRGSSWTLVLCGPKSNAWGFYTKSGWMHWQKFINEAWANRVLWCDDGRTLGDEQQ